ncbi:hypothetical protein VTJ49DRAFT_5517 [Mycothermus thermophilus]|uniref:Uncharacterized protein n=1 Tax=Humicola insolens TaxID=85995 RepID=A0ABR3VKC9_HUMIN
MASRKCNIYFVFGPEPGSYLLWTPQMFKTSKMPLALEQQLANIDKLHWAVVGDNGHVALAYRSKVPEGGEWRCDTLVISDPDKRNFHFNSLDDHIRDRIMDPTRPVRQIALGVEGEHIILRKGGDNAWQLRRNYRELSDIFSRLRRARRLKDIDFVALNPWRRQEFFLVEKDGTIHFQVHESVKQDLEEILRAHNAQRRDPRRTVKGGKGGPNGKRRWMEHHRPTAPGQ